MKTKVVDFCTFYGEYGSENLLLRYEILKDYVDEFVVSESSRSHKGDLVEFKCKKKIKEWGLPEDKFRVIELDIPPSDCLRVQEIDKLNCTIANTINDNLESNLSRVRCRIGKDSLLYVLENYDEDTVFIHGDIDEIVNPEYISSIVDILNNNENSYVRIPLIYLEGSANMRVYNKHTDSPEPWDWALFACKKSTLTKATPIQIRTNKMISDDLYPIIVVDDGVIIEEMGWHFSWMGGKKDRITKSNDYEHFNDQFDWLEFSRYDNSEKFMSKDFGEGDTPPCGDVNLVLKKYDEKLLPKECFSNPIIEKFLFTSEDKNISKSKIINLYEKYDERYTPLWGFCSLDKAGCLIDYVDEICKNVKNPVCVEIGVYGGKSVLPVAIELKRNKKGIVYAIDPWKNEEAIKGYYGEDLHFWKTIDLEKYFQIFKTGIKEYELSDYVKIIRSTSDDAPLISNIDLLYIDGQHTDQALRDTEKYASQIKTGGYCLVDDIDWGEVGKVPELLDEMGFELIHSLQNCYIYIKKEQNSTVNFLTSKKITGTSWIVDNFYEDPDKVREFALNQYYVEGGIGRGFIGRRTENQFLFPGLKERFEEIIGMKITEWESHGMNGRFQNCHSGEPLVYHCDSQRWGGMLYLTPGAPYQCGTTLYANKKTRARSYNDDGWNAAWENIPGDPHLDGTPFEPVDVLGNVYNRLVIFDASCIHSASEYFGTVMENSRLWQMFFFDT